MSDYPELPSAEYRIIDKKKFFVRKFGLGGVVLEEELVEMPTVKTTRDSTGVIISETAIK